MIEDNFKEVNIANYMKEQLLIGAIDIKQAEKFARIYASKGIEGEKVITTMQNGLEETINTVKVDSITGETDWKITNPNGETYVVSDVVFKKKYEIDPENPTMYKPKGGPVNVSQISENVRFNAPWGEEMKIAAGGFIVINSETDMYGIQEKEFFDTYAFIDNEAIKRK